MTTMSTYGTQPWVIFHEPNGLSFPSVTSIIVNYTVSDERKDVKKDSVATCIESVFTPFRFPVFTMEQAVADHV